VDRLGRSGSGPGTPDNRVTGVKVWLVRAMLVATALALVATSPPPTYSDSYETTVAAPSAVLAPDATHARFEVRVLARDLFLATGGALAVVRGGIVAPTDSSFVRVTVDDGEPRATSSTFLTSFSAGTQLAFEGNCAELDASRPCESSFVVTFERTGDMRGDSPVEILWDIDVSARVSKDKGPDRGPFPLPWQVEVAAID
jgi:hypothetical protein